MGEARPGERTGAQMDTVLLTHLHSDHIGDLGEVARQSWLGGRTTPIDIYGPPAPDAYKLPEDAEGDIFGKSGTEDVVKGFAKPTTRMPPSVSCVTAHTTCRRRARA
jgi:ribonuclease BN (tRNA processing enzyme)